MVRDVFSLAAVGDVVLARDDPVAAFDRVLDELGSADIRTCNLEVPLSEEGMPQYAKHVTLHASPAMIEGYVAAGFDLVSLANNHTMDYGPVALMDTIRLLDEHAIAHAGAGPDRATAWGARIHEVAGSEVAFLSFASVAHNGYGATARRPGIAMIRRDPLFGPEAVSPDDVDFMQDQIRAAGDEVDTVVVFFHWGISQSRALSVSQRHLAHAAVDAGADAVIGHHPHVLQGVEVRDGVPIVYSLGNFVFDLQPYFFDTATASTALARLEFAGGGVRRLELVPMWIDGDGNPVPVASDTDQSAAIVADLTRLSSELGTQLIGDGDRLVLPLE